MGGNDCVGGSVGSSLRRVLGLVGTGPAGRFFEVSPTVCERVRVTSGGEVGGEGSGEDGGRGRAGGGAAEDAVRALALALGLRFEACGPTGNDKALLFKSEAGDGSGLAEVPTFATASRMDEKSSDVLGDRASLGSCMSMDERERACQEPRAGSRLAGSLWATPTGSSCDGAFPRY